MSKASPAQTKQTYRQPNRTDYRLLIELAQKIRDREGKQDETLRRGILDKKRMIAKTVIQTAARHRFAIKAVRREEGLLVQVWTLANSEVLFQFMLHVRDRINEKYPRCTTRHLKDDLAIDPSTFREWYRGKYARSSPGWDAFERLALDAGYELEVHNG